MTKAKDVCNNCPAYMKCTAMPGGKMCALKRNGYKAGKPMTEADRIRSMNDEELAKWLADMFDCHYCSEHERIGENPLLRAEQCDQECEKHCLEWLRKPAEEGGR